MSDIRAQVRSVEHQFTTEAREHVRWVHWHLLVFKGEMLINTDDCRDFSSLVIDAHRRVVEYRDMSARGVKLRPWQELVDEASA